MKKLTVLYVSHYSELNGAPISMLDMIGGLEQEKVLPLVLIPKKGMLEKELRRRRIKYFIIPYNRNYRVIDCKNVKEELKSEIMNCKAVLEIAQLIKREKVDIVHSNSTAVDVGARAALLTKTPHIFHARELMEEDFGFEYINKLRMKWLLKKSSKVIAISKTVKEKIARCYNVKTVLLYNGVDSRKYWGKVDILSKDIVQILMCGQIRESKGQYEAIKAMDILRRKGICRFVLTIVGSGTKEYIKELREYIEEHKLTNNIVILPFVEELSELRKQSDISLTCSRMEALGRVTIEAMLAGNCVVGADTGGTRELIGDEQKYGYLYRAGDSNNLSNVLIHIIENHDEAKTKADFAQKMIMAKIDLNNYNKKLNNIYMDLFKNSKSNYGNNRK